MSQTRPLVKAVVAVSAVLTLAGCSSLNPFASSSGPKPTELTAFEQTATIKPLWSASVGDADGYRFVPAVVNGVVYAAGHNGRVSAIKDGSVQWTTDVDARLAAGVGSDGRVVVVVSNKGDVIALNASTGSELWRQKVRAEVLAPPGVNEEVVLVRGTDSRLFAFTPNSGEQRWVYQRPQPTLGLRSLPEMIVESKVAVLGYPNGKLVAVHTDSGAPLWELTVAVPKGVTELERVADVVGAPVAGRREVCAVAYQGRVACFDLSNGSTQWARDFSSSTGLDRDTRFVILADERDAVHGLDAFSGSTTWQQDALRNRKLTRPLIVGGHVVVADFEGYVHVLEREGGALVARTRADSSAVEVPPKRLDSQSFVIQTSKGGVYAYELDE